MPVNPTDPGKKQETAHPLAVALGAGTEIVVAVLAGFLAGQWLDKRLGTAPWLMLAGTMLGITAGLYQLIKGSAQRR